MYDEPAKTETTNPTHQYTKLRQRAENLTDYLPPKYTIVVNLPREPRDNITPQYYKGSIQATSIRRLPYQVHPSECKQDPRITHESPWHITQTRNNNLTTRLTNQHKHNWIDYTHPIVRRRRNYDNYQYYILTNDPNFHTPIYKNDIPTFRINIPSPDQIASWEQPILGVPYRWKDIKRQTIQHINNYIDYTNINIKRNQHGRYYQIHNDDKNIFITPLPPPTKPTTNMQLDGIITRDIPGKLNWTQQCRLLHQHPENDIDYTHPMVQKRISRNHEQYYVLPNERTYHTYLPPTPTLNRPIPKLHLPRPEEKSSIVTDVLIAFKQQQIPKLLKQQQFLQSTNETTKQIRFKQHHDNRINYFDPTVKLSKSGVYYQTGYTDPEHIYTTILTRPELTFPSQPYSNHAISTMRTIVQ